MQVINLNFVKNKINISGLKTIFFYKIRVNFYNE